MFLTYDVTPSYVRRPWVAKRIKNLFPKSKIQEKLNEFTKERTLSNKKDLDFMKEITQEQPIVFYLEKNQISSLIRLTRRFTAFSLVKLLITCSLPAQAISCYNIVPSLDKKNTMVIAYKGLSVGEMGNIPSAIKYFKKALSIDNNYELAQISLDTAKRIMKSH